MKRKVFLATTILVLGLGCSMTAYAQPKTMPDGTVFDAEFYAQNYPDVAAVFGTDENLLYQHYVQYGISEGRLAANSAVNLDANVITTKMLIHHDGSDVENSFYRTSADGEWIKLGAFEPGSGYYIDVEVNRDTATYLEIKKIINGQETFILVDKFRYGYNYENTNLDSFYEKANGELFSGVTVYTFDTGYWAIDWWEQ
ncbi:hypothetical protein BLA28_20205 [Eisenbergiella tayi]|uniref:hypothetical protein n=1 Tax=Eisenbergiella tayi TaxID=1432052 RepID=UPI0008FCE17F|nr:hypothetical protein [Eisenbergiella tayi]OIZ62720.1 hypothetical protein BLA28_20205 [Eisenbergiella tayi]